MEDTTMLETTCEASIYIKKGGVLSAEPGSFELTSIGPLVNDGSGAIVLIPWESVHSVEFFPTTDAEPPEESTPAAEHDIG